MQRERSAGVLAGPKRFPGTDLGVIVVILRAGAARGVERVLQPGRGRRFKLVHVLCPSQQFLCGWTRLFVIVRRLGGLVELRFPRSIVLELIPEFLVRGCNEQQQLQRDFVEQQ
jgi:hypothetical protein